MADVKLSQIASGGAYNPATDTLIAVRSGPSDVRVTLGSAATQATSAFLQAANNLSDLSNAATARTNLGLGTAALSNTSAFLQPGNNLSDVSNPATARGNLGLNTPEVTIATASTTNLGAGGSPNVLVNGSGTIASFGSSASLNATDYALRFNAAVTLTHSSALICPNAVDLSVVANDYVRARYLGSGNWIILDVFQYGAGSGSLNPSGSITTGSLPYWVSGTTLGTGNLSGDISTSGGLVTTIGANKVTFGMMATSTANSLGGYNGSGNYSNVTLATNSNLKITGGTLGINAQIFNVKDYGALGDDSTNDNTAFTNCIAAAAAASAGGIVYIPQGKYILTTQFSTTLATGKSLFFVGDGPNVSILKWTTATGGFSITFTSGALDAGLVGAEGLMFKTLTAGGGTGLSLISGNAPNPGPIKRIFNCVFAGNQSTTYWTNGVLLDGCTFVSILDTKFGGILSAGSYFGVGVQIQNSQSTHAVEPAFNQCRFWLLATGINVTSEIEGMLVCNTVLAAVTIGINWVQSSPAVGLPLLKVTGCHIDAVTYCIHARNIVQMVICDNLLYQNSAGAFSAVFVDNTVNSGTSDNNMICNNVIIGLGGGSSNGIVTLLATYNMICNNRIDNCTTGIWLQATTTNCTVKGNQITNFSGNAVLDSGTANNVISSLAGMGALVYQTLAQSIPNASATTLTYNAAAYDPLGLWNSSTTFTVPAGVTKIKISAGIGMASGTPLTLNIRKNGTTFPGQPNIAVTGLTTNLTTASTVLQVSAGDTFTSVTVQSSGGSINTNGSNVCWFAIEIIG